MLLIAVGFAIYFLRIGVRIVYLYLKLWHPWCVFWDYGSYSTFGCCYGDLFKAAPGGDILDALTRAFQFVCREVPIWVTDGNPRVNSLGLRNFSHLS